MSLFSFYAYPAFSLSYESEKAKEGLKGQSTINKNYQISEFGIKEMITHRFLLPI
jgi:hypothetical protein